MPWIALAISVGGSLLGGMMAGDSARSAAQTSAQAQLEAARIAAEASKFKPYGVTGSFFGKPIYTTDAQGNPVVDINISPELRGYQQQLSQLGAQQLQQGLGAQQQYAPLQTAATGLFNLGAGYLAQTPEQAAQQYMASQQALLAPSRERESALLANQLANTGRTGLSVAQGGGLLAANPEQAALANARAMQDLQLAANAQQAGQQRALFGAGLFGQGAGLLGQYQQGQIGALSPFQANLGLQGQIENLGMNPLEVGAGLGGRSATAGANAGRYLFGGGIGAAEAMQQANAYNPYATALINASTNPQLTQGLSRSIRGYTAGGSAVSNLPDNIDIGGGWNPATATNYGGSEYWL